MRYPEFRGNRTQLAGLWQGNCLIPGYAVQAVYPDSLVLDIAGGAEAPHISSIAAPKLTLQRIQLGEQINGYLDQDLR